MIRLDLRRCATLLIVPVAATTLLAGCSGANFPGMLPPGGQPVVASVAPAPVPARRTDATLAAAAPLAYIETRAPAGHSHIDGLISKYAQHYDVPESLVRRVVQRESSFNPSARNGPYWGLMQIRHDTAQSMGYRGPASGLLDADTNLRYAVKYLRGAYIVAGRNADGAVRNYSRGYYYDAKRQGLLEETGLR